MSDHKAIYLGPIVSLPDHLNYMPDLSRHFMFGFNCLFLLVVFHAALPAQDNPSPGLALVVPLCIPCPPKRQTRFMPACLSPVKRQGTSHPNRQLLACFALLCAPFLPSSTYVRTTPETVTLGRRPEIHTANGHPLIQKRYMLTLVKQHCQPREQDGAAENASSEVRIVDALRIPQPSLHRPKVRVSGDRQSRPPATARSCHRGSDSASPAEVSPAAAVVVAESGRGVRSRGGGGVVVDVTARDGGGDNLCWHVNGGLSRDFSGWRTHH